MLFSLPPRKAADHALQKHSKWIICNLKSHSSSFIKVNFFWLPKYDNLFSFLINENGRWEEWNGKKKLSLCLCTTTERSSRRKRKEKRLNDRIMKSKSFVSRQPAATTNELPRGWAIWEFPFKSLARLDVMLVSLPIQIYCFFVFCAIWIFICFKTQHVAEAPLKTG